MDKKVEILLGSEKNINSVNVDAYGKIELVRNTSELNEFTVNDLVNSTEQFDVERETNQVYRIYGRIEWLSLLNGVSQAHNSLEDFFNPYSGNSKDIMNSFDFYLVAPASGATYGTIYNTDYRRRNFQVIVGKDDIEIYNAGFTNNVYGEQVYAFNFKTDVDVEEYYDYLGFPLTELFIYAQYKKYSPITEQMSRTSFSITGNKSKVDLTTKDFVVGDIVENLQGTDIQDVITYDDNTYYQEQVDPQIFYIRTRYFDSGNKWLEWSYNPFIPLRLRYLDSVVSEAKLSEIVENTTTLSIYPVNNPTHVLNATKSTKQIISTNLATVINWNTQPTSYYTWIPSSGRIIFTVAGTYNINFKTQIYLPYGTDKYIAQVYLEKYDDYEDEDIIIPSGLTKFYISNSVQGINVTESFAVDDELTVRVRLIPNPNERKIFAIPDYAKMILNDGKYVWRDILPQGYIDPLTGDGVDYPFFNGKRYLFEPIVFDVIPNLNDDPDLKHQPTLDVFNEISYYKHPTSIDATPLTPLDDIEKPCQ